MFDAVLKALAMILSLVITGILIPYIKSKTTAQERETLLKLIDSAVSAAEQMPVYSGSGKGDKKKQYVMDWLRERGIDVEYSELTALVESAVYALKN